MAFPQQSDPQIIHLFVDNFQTLFSGTTNDIESFYSFCDDNCINFLTFENAINLIPDNSQLISDFMVSGLTNHGICDISIEIDLFDPELSGLSEFNLIKNYNQNNQPFNWITVKNPFWLFGKEKITYLDCATINLDKITITLSNGVTTIDPILDTVGNFIQIYGEIRQIKQIVNPTTIIVDRPFSTSYGGATLIAVNVADDRILDYETFIYRVRKLKQITYLNNIKIEGYVARRIDPTDLSGLSTYFDRILIENNNNLLNYCLYNENITQNVRQTLLYLTNNKSGTIGTNIGSNIISGYGTDFENDLVVGGKIVVSGQVLTIQSINNIVGSPQQATITQQATLSVNTTYSPYFELLPIYVITPLLRQQWLTTPANSKSYADVYRFFTITGYTVGANIQTGNSPICYNNETNSNIINSTNLKGLSIERSSVALSIDSNVKTSGPLCSICENDYVFPIVVTGTTTTCNGAANGSITVFLNPTETTPPFTYSFSGQNGVINIVSSDNIVTCNNLYSGLWIINVTDSGGNIKVSETNFFTIGETFNPTIITSGNTIIFNISGGTPTYYISSVPSGTFFQSGLTDGSYTYTASSGTYDFIIGDSFSCITDTITVSVISADTIAINVDYNDPTCDIANDGTITINVNSPGVLPYTYTFSKSGGQTIITSASTLSNLTSGLWTVFVTDASSEVSNLVNINLAPTFDASSISSINSVTINVSGGTPPYTILGNTIPQFSAQTNGGSNTYVLPSGNVIFSVTDSNGCTKILPASIPINNLLLDINILSYVNPNSDECANGEVVVSAIGGIPPYLIYSAVNSTSSIAYSNTTGIFTGLTSGFWDFTVTDSALVNNTASIGLTLFTTYDVSYYISGQTICVNASGGCTGYYSVFINGDGYLYDTGSTTNCFAALCGNNHIEVIDGNIADPYAITIVSGGTFTANTYVVCPLGLTYVTTPISCEDVIDGSVILTATGGTPPYLYYLVNPTNVGGPVLVNYTGIFNNLDNYFPLLWSGYTIDISGDTTFVEFNVVKNFYKNIEQYGTGYCVTVSGGTAPYTIIGRKNNNSPQRPQNQNNIPPGQIITTFTASTAGTYCFSATCGFIYSVVVMDANECPEDEEPIIFTLYCPLNLLVSNVTNVSCSGDSDGSISVYGVGGQEPYISYSATNGGTTYVLGGGGSATFLNLSGGTWTVYVEDSVNQIASIEVDVNSLGIDLTTSINYSSKTWCIVASSFRESQYYLTINGDTGNTQTILDGVTYCYPISGCSGSTVETFVCRIPFAYQRLYDFSTNEGAMPYGGLIRNSTDGLFYGLTSSGGDFGFGTIFRYNPFSDTLQVLHHFSGTTYSDGESPEGSLIRNPNGTFYGVTTSGGNGYGTIFSFDSTGNYNVLYRFNGTDGDEPIGTLVRSTSVLYGMTKSGGIDNSGVIFSYSLSGTLTVLHEFDQTSNPDDGFTPYGSLLLYGGALYGTTAIGGRGFSGVLFRCTLTGNYTVLDEFNYGGGNNLQYPLDGVIQTGGKFYGTTFNNSGVPNYGGIYSADTNGNIGKIYQFDGVTGSNPIGGLELGADGLLYGMTSQGGDFNVGTIYQIDKEGLNIQKMHDFGDYTVNDGASPQGRLFQASNRVLYGMTVTGGDGSSGTIFRIDPFDSVCCSEETITIGDGIDFSISENYIGGVRNICVDIDITNSFPPPYYVSINGYQNPYDSNNPTNCYPVNQCSEINVEACHLYFNNTSNVLQFPNTFTSRTPSSLIFLNGKFYGTTERSIFSCDTQGNNFEFLYYEASFEKFDYGISASNEGTFLYANKTDQGASKLFEFDLTNRTLNILDSCNFNDPDAFKSTKPIITTNGKLYGFSKGNILTFPPTYGSIYHYNFSSSTYTIDYIFSGTGITNPFSFPLEASNGLLYGLAEIDSTIGKGGIFSFDINTNTFNTVHQFQLTGGTNPTGGLVEVDGLLYGVCRKGGTYSGGTIFSYNTSTNEVVHLHNFGPLNVGNGTLLNVNGILYGTATDGDITNAGIIFSYNTFNNEYKRLLVFAIYPTPFYGVNPPPIQQLIRINNDLYGINENGGPTDNGGTIYKLGFESCCKTETFPAISGFTGFTVSTNTIDAVTTEFCININEEIFFQPPYTIDFNGTVYTVTGTTGHCYTITGCGVFDIIVCSGVEGIQASGCCYEQTVGVACTDLSLFTSATNIPCGDDSGFISAFATGGTTLYTFELTNGSNTYTSSGVHNQIVTFTGLTAGLWNLTVTDTASNTTTQQYNLSNFIVDYSYQGNQVCVSISSTTYTSSTFFVLVNGTSYGYNNSLSANCYTVTGCTNNQLFIYELITNNLPYTVIDYFTGSPINTSSYSTLVEPLDNIFYGTSGNYLFSANTQGNIAPVINFPADQPRQYLYLNNGIIYGATTNSGINSTGIIFSCDTSGNYGTFFEPQFIYVLARNTNPPIFEHSNGTFYGTAMIGINGVIYSCDTQNNGNILFNQPLINANITSIVEASNGIIYGIADSSNLINSGQIFSADTLGNVGVLYSAVWPPTPPEPSIGFTKLQEFIPGLIYSTSSYGGQYNGGTIFNFDLTGNINILHEFSGGNNDGLRPKSQLFQGSNGLLYGTTEQGGQYGYGVVYSIDVYGNNFSILHHFEDSTTGYYPSQAIVEAANGNLYGITFFTVPGLDSTLIYELESPYSGCSYFSTFDTICDLSLNTVTTNIPCFDNNGLISAIAFGGVPDYFYTLTNGLTIFTQTGTTNQTITFTGLTAGTYTLTVVDSSTFTASTATTVYDLSNFDVTLSTSGNQVCIVVTSTTVPSQTYTVQLQGNTYSYTASTTGTCYTVTGCGLTNVVVCNDVDTTLYKLLSSFGIGTGIPEIEASISDEINGIFYGTTSNTIYSCTTSGNLSTIYNFIDGEIVRSKLYGASNGLLYGLIDNSNTTVGSIFTVNSLGIFNVIYVFSGGTYGEFPVGQLEESLDGHLYGVTSQGGDFGGGTIFRIDFSGNNFTILHSFSGNTYGDGYAPNQLTRYGFSNRFYGVTFLGGTSNYGTIFSCDTLGNYGVVYSFTNVNDGSQPLGKLLYSNNGIFYGTTNIGGASGFGTIYTADTQGNVGSIYEFVGTTGGTYIYSGLVKIGDTLFGTASDGGLNNGGTIFSCDTSGNNFQVIHNFDSSSEVLFTLTKGSDNNLYGTTRYGGDNNTGSFFKVNINPEEPCCFYGSVDVSCTLYLNTIGTNIPCFDDSGAISVLGFGGYPNYEYTLSGVINGTATGTTNEVINFTGLTPGIYTVTVTDISGNSVSQNYDITNFDVIVNFTINTAQTGNEICLILTSTTLTANTYYVEIEGNVYTYDTSSLTGNCYTVTGCGTTLVTISGGTSGCTYNTALDIPCNLVIYTYYTNIPCETDSGIIQVIGYGGIPTYTFTLVGPTTTTIVTGTTGQIIDFTGLTSGQYSISVIDTIGFTQSSAVTIFNLSYFDASVVALDNQICVTISGESLTANTYVVNIDGFLYNYDTSSLTGNCYTVTGCGTTLVTISGGTSGCTYNASVDVSCALLVDVLSSSIPCENNSGIISLLGFGGTPDYTYLITNGVSNFTQTGTTNQTVTFSSLTSGSYSISVIDSGGLTASTATTVLNLSYFDVDVTTNDDKICVVISADVITASTYFVTIGGDVYNYDTSSLTGNCYTVTGCGLTTVTISGGTSGCTYQTGVEVSCDLLLNVSSTNIPCEDNSGTVSVLAFAGTPNYTYTITNGLIFDTQTGSTNQTVTFSGLSAGLYNINVVDSGGLTASTATTVINLSIFDANVTLNGNQLSVSVSSNTITAETYTVNVGGTLYPYNINTNPNLFTVSGCGTTDVTITSFIQGPINYGNTLLEFNDNNYVEIQSFNGLDSFIAFASVVESNKTLYGVITGGINENGLLYSCDLSGNNLTILHRFSGFTVGDGSQPETDLICTSDGFIVGTTKLGGNDSVTFIGGNPVYTGHGIVFKYEIATNTLSYIHIFSGISYNDGGYASQGNQLEINGIIYGTTLRGGFSGITAGYTYGNGVIYTCNTSGNYGIIHNFSTYSYSGGSQPTSITYGNDGYIYGVTFDGGIPFGSGIIFKIDLNGNFTLIKNFSGTTYGDGLGPTSLITGSNGILYGTTRQGGINNEGTIFSCDTLGNYGIIHNFSSTTEGRWPQVKLREYYNTEVFFGTCYLGGTNNRGTIFTCNTIGDFGVIHHFQIVGNLSNPSGQLYLASNGSLYGTTFTDNGIYSWVVDPPSATTLSSCTYTTSIDIPCSLTLDVVSSSIPCDDDSGIISVIASAGTPYYTYTIVGPGPTIFTQTGDTGQVVSFSGLVAGLYNINVVDNGGLTASTAATIYNLSFFDVDVNVNGNEICLTISSSTLSAETYFVQIQGTTYTYDTTLSANCFTVTGCGPTDITVVTGAPGIASEYEYSILHHFSGTTYGDGSNPFTNSIIYYDNQLYGTTRFGGSGDGGTIFRLNEDGSNYQVVASFTAKTQNNSQIQNIRVGEEPVSRLIVGPGNSLYGCTAKGGYATNSGTLFSCDTTTGVITVPNGGNAFGAGNQGITFHSNGKFYRSSSSYTNFYGSIGAIQFGSLPIGIHTFNGIDGSFPYDGVTEHVPTGKLYGVTHDSSGPVVPIGNYGGVIFSIEPDGTNYTVIHRFSGTTYNDGANPFCRLFLATNGLFYGTTEYGGFYDAGTIFTCSTIGDYGIIHHFEGFTYEDGENPMGSLTQDPTGKLYGITQNGGKFNFGSVYVIDETGNNYEIIYHFSGRTDGATDGSQPKGEINYINGSLYGMTFQGGDQGEFFGNGVIYKLSVFNPPVTGCSFSTTVNIPCGGPLDIFTTVTNVPCQENNGSITTTVTGGSPNYQYQLTNGVINYSQNGGIGDIISFNGLSPGVWTLTVTDSIGNTLTESYTLSTYNVNIVTGLTNNEVCISIIGATTTGETFYVLLQGNTYVYDAFAPFNCFQLTGCGTNNIIVSGSSTGCTFEGIFDIPCPPLEVYILTYPAFCYNGLSQIIVGATGGTQPYTIILNEISPIVTAYTATTIFSSPNIFPYNWAEFYVPVDGTFYGTVIDANGNILGSQVITTTNTYDVNINFTLSNVTISISGNSPFGFSNIILNNTLYGPLNDGTYTYPISCGTNTVIVDGYVYFEGYYGIACSYSGSTTIPCDLTCDVDFIQPQCSGASVSAITVFITGGTSPYDITIERPITNIIYSATTNSSPYVMTGLTLTEGGWTVVVTDDNGDTCINEIFVDTTFDAFVSSILGTTGFCITISGGTPLYSISIDKNDMGGNIYNDGTYCFTASCGPHEVVIYNFFATPPCPITLLFDIPCPDIDCEVDFTNPTCGKDDGGVLITVNSGTPPYFYQITNGILTYDSGTYLPTNVYTFGNLGVGTWTVTVVDSATPRQICETTIDLVNSFQVVVSAYTATSLTYGLICFDIAGGLPPYTILIDNILVGSGLTPTGSLCYTATCGVNHSYLVFDSADPCTTYVNQDIFVNSSFDTNTDWLQPFLGVSNCTNPGVNPAGYLSRYGFIDTIKGAFVYTALTSALVALGGCYQNIPLSQNFIFPYSTPLSVTYSWQIGTGLVSGITPGYLSFSIETPFGNSVPTTSPAFPGFQSYRTYSGIHTQTTTTVPLSGIYSGYVFNLVESGGYSANTSGSGSLFEITGAQLTILSYTLPCPCAATGTTYVPCFVSLPIITVITYQNPPCLVNPDGIIVVSGSSGVPPYTYSATNGTISYTNTTGIFTGLTEDIWYLSLIDSLGQVSTTTEVISLNYSFYANIDVNLSGFCITISGGTQPYVLLFDGDPLPWNYSNITNCYTADCQTTAVIVVQDSSG